MKTRSKKLVAKIVAPMLIATLAVAPTIGSLTAFAANNGHAAPAYKTQAEAEAAARDLNERLTGEGSVLLKNNENALPLSAAETKEVMVFGSAATSLQGGSGTVNGALAAAGYGVYESVITESVVQTAKNEVSVDQDRYMEDGVLNQEAYDKAVAAAQEAKKAAEATLKTASESKYKKVGVIVLKRGGGEGSDLAVATSEKAADETENDGWTHERLALNNKGEEVKHNQMLTAAELKLIEEAKTICEKIVVILNTSNAMEMYNLEKDAGVDSILWIGRPGTTGINAVPKLLRGDWNPSGKLVAEWYKDFTADPTWYNSIANVQNDAGSNSYILEDGSQASSIGLHGVDYSEDIYIGYKYYETVYAEILAGRLTYDATKKELTKGSGNAEQATAWYNDNVVYPFGYGLSYTNFEMKVVGISDSTLSAKDISSSVGNPAKIETVTITVDVTNTGKTTGKEVVEIYSQAPYTVGGIEKASVNLVAYAKTKNLRPGEKQTIALEVNLQDMASYDYSDANGNVFRGYELEKGEYTLYASNTSHCTADTAKATLEITADTNSKGATLGLDDYSGNEIHNLFSDENGRYNSIRSNDVDWNGDGKVDAKDKMFTEEQVLLSRADMVGTFPKAPVTVINTGAEETLAVSQIPEFNKDNAYAVGAVVKVTEVTTGVTGTSSTKYYKFTKAHTAGAEWDATEVENLSGEYVGGLVVTQEFADLMDYYAKFDLNLWLPDTAYFAPSNAYAANAEIGVSGTKEIYKATTAIAAVASIDTTSGYTANSYVRNGSQVYKLKADITAPVIKDNGAGTDGIATQAYAVGDIVKYLTTNRWGGGITVNTVIVTAAIAKDSAFVNSNNGRNCRTFAAADRLTDENSTKMTDVQFLEANGATLTDKVNTGNYVYSDKLFMGDAGVNGYMSDAGLYDVTDDMMHGWSQMADAAAQEEGIAKGDWIYFNELNGIKFTDKEVIKSGRFAGMTGEEVWLKFMNQWTWDDLYRACWAGGNNGLAVENLGIPAGGIQDSPTSFARTYTWCDNCSIASTWNVDLGYEQGRVTASLGLLANTSKINNVNTTRNDEWLNPAINFHRTPFSGRNNEYYGQDGYHAGWFAQAVVRGIQDTGVSSHLKHMFLNDQETNRNSGDLFAWVSEQAIREIYIKPFQIGIQEGGAEGAMSAFARIGGVPTPVNDNMCNLLVRQEWGSTNFMFHPDMYSPQANVASEDLMLRTGHNHAPGDNNYVPSKSDATPNNKTWSGRWDAEYENPLTGTLGGVYIGKDDEATGQEAYYSNNQWYIVRYSAMIMYSEYANNSHAMNGIIPSEYKGYAVSATAGSAISVDASFKQAEDRANVVYSLSGNKNPAGISIDAKTGMITGNIAEAGTYTVTVQAMCDKWISATATYTINVAGTATGGNGQDGQNGVGVKDATINADGHLIITLTDDRTIDAGKVTADGATGGDGVGVKSATVNADGHLIITLTNDKTIDAGNVVGPKGETGATGPEGPKGDKGDAGEGGCGGSIGTTVMTVGASMALLAAAIVVISKRRNSSK